MATETVFVDEVRDDDKRRGIHWSAVWGGLFVALAVWLVLNFLGLAIGLGVLEPLQRGALEEFGVGAVIWMIVVQVAALFCGGYVASRSINFMARDRGLLHGLVVWGFTTIVALGLGGVMLGSMASLGANIFAGTVAGREGVSVALPTADFDQNAVFGSINARLREQGKPEITEQQQAATVADANRMASQSRQSVDRTIFAQALSRNSGLSFEEARDLAGQANLGAQQQRLERGAEAASDAASRIFWALFFANALALLAALAGGVLGSARGRRAVTAPAVVTREPTPTTPAPPVGAREVYP